MIEDWVEEEYASLDLGDARLNRRAKYFVSQAAGIGNSNPDRYRSAGCQFNGKANKTSDADGTRTRNHRIDSPVL